MASRRPALPLLLPPSLGRNMIQRLVRVYNRNQRCRPCLTRSLTSIAGLCAGDLLAQTSTGDGIDTKRLARVGAFAFLLQAPVCFHFYRLLDKHVFPRDPVRMLAVATKVLIDQALFSPAYTAVYYGAMKTFEGRPCDTLPTLREKLWPTIKAGWLFWVPAHSVNFCMVAPQYRVLSVLGFSVAWTAILSTIAARSGAVLDDPLTNVRAVARASAAVESFLTEGCYCVN